MAYDIRLVKIVTGELVIGKYENGALNEVAIMQTVPTQQGIQILMLPYGYPFEQDFVASIDEKYHMYTYKTVAQEVLDKYLEAISNLTLSSGGINPKGPQPGGSGLII